MATGYVVAWLDSDVGSSSSSSSATRQAQSSSSTAGRGNARLVLPLPSNDGAPALNLEIVHADPHLVASARIPLSADGRDGGKVLLRAPVDGGYAGGRRGVLEVELCIRYHQLEDTPLPAPAPVPAPTAAAPAPKTTPVPIRTPSPPHPAVAPIPAPAPKPTPAAIPIPPVAVPSSSAAATARAAAAAAGHAPAARPSLISEAALDRIIGTLSEMGAPPTPNQPQHKKQSLALSHLVSESDIRKLCAAAKEIFLRQPMLLDLKPPIKICGDVHGQLDDVVTLFGGGVLRHPSDANYLFLGNYVDFGPNSIETICLLLAYKVKFPDNFHLLRGSHESFTENKLHGFLDDCMRLYGDVEIWKDFNECFKCLPVAALVDGKMFCVHGGLSPELINIDQIRCIPRPTTVPDVGLLRDLLWSNPAPDADMRGWKVNKNAGGPSDRGVGSSSYVFGSDVVGDFLKKNNLKLICRGHQAVERGYHFFANRRQLVTIFSAPNFRDVHGNPGAVMSVVPRSSSLPAKDDLNKPRHERPVYLDETVAYSFKLQVKPTVL